MEINTASELKIKDNLSFFTIIHDKINKGLASQVKAAPPKRKPIVPENKAIKESPQDDVVQ